MRTLWLFVLPILVFLGFSGAPSAHAAQCSDVYSATNGINANRQASGDTLDLSGVTWGSGPWPASGIPQPSGEEDVSQQPGGNYELELQSGAELVVLVNGNLTIERGTRLNAGGSPDQLLIVVRGNLTIQGGGNNPSSQVIINGLLYAAGSASIGSNVYIDGAVAAGGAISEGNRPVDFSASDVNADLLAGLCDTGAGEGPLPVFDDFEGYPPGSVSGLNGGIGWGGSWQGAGGQSIVDTSGNPLLFQASNGLSIRSNTTLEVSGNNSRVATRPLSSTFTGDQVYLSMLVRFQGTPGPNDFLGFWLQQPGFGDSPQFGVKVDEGGGGNADFFVRLDTNAAYSTNFQPGQTYLLVARFDKDGSNYYNQGRLWVDPQCTDAPPPTPSATISRNPVNRVTQISELGFRSENLSGGAAVQVGQVAAGERWTDVVQCTCFQNGLEATFYNNYQSRDPFPDNPVLTRLDPEVDFNWGGGSPDPAVDNNDFAVQWQGAIEVPQTGNYRFRTRTDDGVRLWVDDLAFDQAIIDDWNDQSASNNTSGAIYLEAGHRYAIRMQFYENGGQAVAELQWDTPADGNNFEIIPESALFACLPVAAPLLESTDAVCGASDVLRVRFDQTPRSRMLDTVSAETPSFYTVEALSSGNTIAVDSATLEPGGYSVLLDLASDLASEERYRVTVSDVQDVGGLVMSPNPASVDFDGGGTGLTTFYWNNVDLSGPTVAQQNSANINEDYGSGSPIPGVVNNDRFSIRWSGFIVAPATGDYRFQTRTDDGVRLWVQDLSNPIINQWVDQSPTTHTSGVITLQQGQSYALRMEMYENRGGAVAELRWDTPQSSGFEIVPASALFNCPDAGNQLDHFRIISGGNAVTCSPAPVTIQASDASGQPVTDYAGTISLATSTGQGDWFAGAGANGSLNRGAGNSGQASYGFVPADNGVVTLDLRHTLADTVNVDVADGTVTELAGFDPDILFAETGFLFHQAGDLSSAIASLVAGRDSSLNPGGQSLQLTAVRTNDNTGACEAFLTGPQTVDIGYVCDNPANCALADALQINGQAVASNDSGSTANSSSLSLDFGDATTSSASLVLNYRDAGRISLFASRPLTDAEGNPTGGEIAGSSNAFVSVPAGFCVAATDASGECAGDPATCSVLTTAGSDFQVGYQAMAWQQAGETGAEFCTGNSVTPGFERLHLNLAHELVAPTGGEAGNFTPAQVSFGTGAGGASNQLQQISEVGAFRVRIPAGQSYLGEALPEAASAVIGRFIPARFVVNLADAGEFAPECTGTPGFTYIGQDFGWQVPPSILISAQNQQGDLTTNYTRGDFRKLQASDVARDLPDTDATQQEQDSADLLEVTVTAQPAGLTTGAPGQMSYQFSASDSLVYPKTAVSQVPPFNPSLSFAIRSVVDSDGVTGVTSLPLSFIPAANQEIRYGRWSMENVYGPENIAALPMPFQAQYWTGSRFELNEADNCSPWNTAGISGTSDHHSLAAASGTLGGGTGGPLSLEPTGSQGTDTLVWQQPVWLQHFWNDAATLQNPSALATFGVYRGHDRVIYWREP